MVMAFRVRQVNAALRCLQSLHRMAGLLALGGAIPNFSVLLSAGGNGKVLGRLSAFPGGMEPEKT